MTLKQRAYRQRKKEEAQQKTTILDGARIDVEDIRTKARQEAYIVLYNASISISDACKHAQEQVESRNYEIECSLGDRENLLKAKELWVASSKKTLLMQSFNLELQVGQ